MDPSSEHANTLVPEGDTPVAKRVSEPESKPGDNAGCNVESSRDGAASSEQKGKNPGQIAFQHLGHVSVSSDRVAQIAETAPETKTRLDDETLAVVKKYLQNASFLTESSLDEHDIIELCEIASRYAKERTVWPSTLINSEDHTPQRSSTDEEEFIIDESVFQRESFHVLATEFFKTDSYEAKVLASLPNKPHNKTVSWLRKAAGLERPYHTFEQHPQSQLGWSESEEEYGSKPDALLPRRRITRTMIKSSRDRKREERVRKDNEGLEALLGGIKDLEKEQGDLFLPSKRFAQDDVASEAQAPKKAKSKRKDTGIRGEVSRKAKSRMPKKKKQPRREEVASTGGDKGVVKTNEPALVKPGRLLVASLPGGQQITISKLLVYGRHESGASEEELRAWRRERKRRHNRDYYLQRKKQRLGTQGQSKGGQDSGRHHTKSNSGKPSRQRVATSSRHHLLHEPEQLPVHRNLLAEDKPSNLIKFGPRDPGSVDERTADDTPPVVGASLPRPKTPASARDLDAGETTRTVSSTKGLTNRKQSAASSLPTTHVSVAQAKLKNFLGGSGRRWAVYEFFYSDIDREFYSSTQYLSDLARIGVNPDVELTKREWSVVRRKLRSKPRRFSKAFISSQIKKRDLHRNMIRKKTSSRPVADGTMRYRYPLPNGTKVTAHNKRFRVLHRGSVLGYNKVSCEYLIQFDMPGLGNDFCPDTDVSSDSFDAQRADAAHGFPGRNESSITQHAGAARVDVRPPAAAPTERAGQSQPHDDGNGLLSLVSTVEEAIVRKGTILGALATINATRNMHSLLMSGHETLGAHAEESALCSELHLADRILAQAVHNLEVFHGQTYHHPFMPGSSSSIPTSNAVVVYPSVESSLLYQDTDSLHLHVYGARNTPTHLHSLPTIAAQFVPTGSSSLGLDQLSLTSRLLSNNIGLGQSGISMALPTTSSIQNMYTFDPNHSVGTSYMHHSSVNEFKGR